MFIRLGWAATELVAGVNILDSAVISFPEKFQISRQKMLLHLSVYCKTSENGGVVLGARSWPLCCWLNASPLTQEASVRLSSHTHINTHIHTFCGSAWVRGLVSFVWMRLWRQRRGKLTRARQSLHQMQTKSCFLDARLRRRLVNYDSLQWKFVELECFGYDSEPIGHFLGICKYSTI